MSMRVIILLPGIIVTIFLLLTFIKRIVIVKIMLIVIETRNRTLWLHLISKLLALVELCPNWNMRVDIIFAHSDWLWGRQIILRTLIYGIVLYLVLFIIIIIFILIQFYLVDLANLFRFVVLNHILSHKPIRIPWHLI